MKNFKKLKIWEKGMEIVKSTYSILESLPPEEKYILKSQALRAAISIPSNIAEGSAKSSRKAYLQYLETALGSSFELETQIILIEEIYEIQEIQALKRSIEEEQKMIMAFIKTVRQRLKLETSN